VTHTAHAPAGAQTPRLSVVAPCLDEVDVIETVVRTWDALLAAREPSSEIVICDDGSTDGTADLLERLSAELPRLRVVRFEHNGGYGRALGAAIAASRGAVVVTLDSDGQFKLEDGLDLAARLEREGLDCVTGYRRRKSDTALRVLADRGLNGLVRAMFGLRLRDTNCALKALRGDLARGLRLEARGYPTPTEVVLRLHAAGARLGEAPVDHLQRPGGRSKLQPLRTAWAMARFLVYLRSKLRLAADGIIVEP
jgi:glycosyltransferase involved in cell wall biosynthesis